MWTRFRLAAVVVIIAIAACESSPFEPEGLGERVPLGQKISDEVGGDTVGRYSFEGRDSGLYAVFFEAVQGSAQLLVSDSTHPYQSYGLLGGPGSPPFSENVTPLLVSVGGAVFNIRIMAVPSSAHARFTFLVYQIDRRPERIAGRFGTGDTIAGETIDPIVDVDEFTVDGEAGQEVVGVAEAQGPVGSGTIWLNVVDPITHFPLASVVSDAGTPAFTTGRFRFPATHDYTFVIGSASSSNGARYSGRYRFWSYLINRAPEHHPAALVFDTPITDNIEQEGDVDEFTFSATAGQMFNAFLQAGLPFRLEAAPQGGDPIATVTAQPTDTALLAHATGRFQAAQAGTYVVRVVGSGTHLIADKGPYRIFAYPIDPRPEHVPETITAGDTIAGESIDRAADVDNFSFNGVVGEEYNFFLQALSGSTANTVVAEVLPPNGNVLATVSSNGTDSQLLDQPTGRFALSVSGAYHVRISSAVTYAAGDTGAYRFLLYRVNAQPESSPPVITLGDSVNGERIEVPGDYDRFTLAVPAQSLANIVLLRDSTIPDGLVLSVTGSSGSFECYTYVYINNVGGNGTGCGTLSLGAGNHVVLVQGTSSVRNGYRGAYRLHTHVINRAAEMTPDSLTVGDIISGDAIDPLGDIDTYYFRARRGDHIDVRFQAMGVPNPTYGLWLGVVDSTGHSLGASGSRMGGTSLDEYHTGRIDIPADGRYQIQVSGVNGGRLVVEQGPYRFALDSLPTGIETAGATLLPGDSVGSEQMDFPGDVDRFLLTGAAGQELLILFQAMPETAPLWLAILDTTTRDTLATQLSAGYEQSSGRFFLPANGVAWAQVLEPRFCDSFGCGTSSYSKVGPYWLKVIAINRAPEAVPSAVSIGDTVSGDAVDPVGDIDDFIFSGTAGTTVQVYFQTPQGVCCFDPLLLELIDPANGVVLGSVTSRNPTSNLEDQTTGTVVLPRTDQFRVRVRGSSDRYGTGVYRFRIVQTP